MIQIWTTFCETFLLMAKMISCLSLLVCNFIEAMLIALPLGCQWINGNCPSLNIVVLLCEAIWFKKIVIAKDSLYHWISVRNCLCQFCCLWKLCRSDNNTWASVFWHCPSSFHTALVSYATQTVTNPGFFRAGWVTAILNRPVQCLWLLSSL